MPQPSTTHVKTQANDPSSITEMKLECRELASITLDKSDHDFNGSRPSSASTGSSSFPQMISVTSYMRKYDVQDMKFQAKGALRPHNEINDLISEAKTKPLDYRQDWSVAAETTSLRNLCSSLLMTLDDSQHYETMDSVDCVSVCSFDMNSVQGDDWRRETISEWSGDDIDDEEGLHK